MDTKFNFKSQVATSREQSERLLALGLKKETADMHWRLQPYYNDEGFDCGIEWSCNMGTFLQDDAYELFLDYIPAWSLHRLLNLSPESVEQEIPYFTKDGNVELVNRDGIVTKAWGGESLYDALINFFQWLIKERYFNKEYLV